MNIIWTHKRDNVIIEIKKQMFNAIEYKHSIYGKVLKFSYGIGHEQDRLWKIFNPNLTAKSDIQKVTIFEDIPGTPARSRNTYFAEFLSYNSDGGYAYIIIK